MRGIRSTRPMRCARHCFRRPDDITRPANCASDYRAKLLGLTRSARLHRSSPKWTSGKPQRPCDASALAADSGVSPFPCGQLLFEWGVSAMRREDLDCAESKFAELDTLLPVHAPGRGHRAEVALARGQMDLAAALIAPLLATSDDPEYRGTYAEILLALGDEKAAREAEGAADAYELPSRHVKFPTCIDI